MSSWAQKQEAWSIMTLLSEVKLQAKDSTKKSSQCLRLTIGLGEGLKIKRQDLAKKWEQKLKGMLYFTRFRAMITNDRNSRNYMEDLFQEFITKDAK